MYPIYSRSARLLILLEHLQKCIPVLATYYPVPYRQFKFRIELRATGLPVMNLDFGIYTITVRMMKS